MRIMIKQHQGDKFPYFVLRLFWVVKTIHRVPWLYKIRWLWNALTYDYEICFDCGRKNIGHVGTYWLADDDLWLEVIGHFGNVLCPLCFTGRCNKIGIPIYWKPLRCDRS